MSNTLRWLSLLKKGGSGGGGYPEPTGNIEITENGSYDVKDKATAEVNVASGGDQSWSFDDVFIDDGKTRFVVEIAEVRKTISISVYPNKGNRLLKIDWGDGKFTETPDDSSASAITAFDHEYEKAGIYEIIIESLGDYAASTYRFFPKVSDTADKTNSYLAVGFGRNCDSSTSNTPAVATSRKELLYGACFVPEGQSANSPFNDCSHMKKSVVDAGNAVQYPLFNSCYALTDLTVINPKKSITSIVSNTIANCSELKEFEILETVTTIADGAFTNSDAIVQLILPQSIVSVATLRYMTGLETVIIMKTADLITVGATAFAGSKIYSTDYKGHVYVEDDLVDSYKTATNWAQYEELLTAWSEAPDDIKQMIRDHGGVIKGE